VPPLGFDGDGKTYRVNSDGVAVAVADALKATKLIFITPQDGLRFNAQLIRQMLVAELQKLLQQNSAGFAPEMLSKAQHAIIGCAAGVQRVHIINGRVDDGLLAEVFSNEGIGTLIYANEYQQIRPAKKKDVRAIQLLTKKAVESEELVKRSRASIEKSWATTSSSRLTRTGGLRGAACACRTRQRRAGLPVRGPFTRKPGHRPQADPVHREQGRDSGLNELITLSTRPSPTSNPKAVSSRAPRRSPARPPREIRPERPQFQGAGEETQVSGRPSNTCRSRSQRNIPPASGAT